MLKIRVIPCLLLKDGGLVKTVKFREPIYISDPINAVRIYNEKEVDELIFLDITATSENKKPPFKIISEIASECFMPLTYGGGIRSLEDIKKIFNLGVEKVCINSYAVENPLFIKSASDIFGGQSIVVSIDVKKNLFGKYEVFAFGGRKSTGLDPVNFAVQMEQVGAGEVLLTSIDRDGMWEGYDVELIKNVTAAVNIPVIACGGAGKIEDFAYAVKEGNASAVAAGSMIVFQGKGLGVLINFPTKDELQTILN